MFTRKGRLQLVNRSIDGTCNLWPNFPGLQRELFDELYRQFTSSSQHLVLVRSFKIPSFPKCSQRASSPTSFPHRAAHRTLSAPSPNHHRHEKPSSTCKNGVDYRLSAAADSNEQETNKRRVRDRLTVCHSLIYLAPIDLSASTDCSANPIELLISKSILLLKSAVCHRKTYWMLESTEY